MTVVLASATVAALYVDEKGAYSRAPNVDVWGERRDARLYDGPFPVVAHPPCSRWSRMAPIVQKRYGYRVGDDGGLFARALYQVREWRGVLEHPAYSKAWAAFGLPRPDRRGGWSEPDRFGGRACHVEQGRYGHPARKATWLYAVSVAPLPGLEWGPTPDCGNLALVSWCSNHTKGHEHRRRVGKRAASATPERFRDVLLGIARSAC